MVFSTMEKNCGLWWARFVRLATRVKMDSMMHYWEKLGSIVVENVDPCDPSFNGVQDPGEAGIDCGGDTGVACGELCGDGSLEWQ